jgi:hypothetical protein
LEKHLHIISLNIPYPADYGGMYDLFYKLPALQKEDVKIYLHCFFKDRNEQAELNKYCEKVFYYPRNTSSKSVLSKLPYIVASRNDETLATRLLQDDHPILMEGTHCTYLVNDKRFKNRKMFVRVHNVESEYYRQLYKFSNDIKKKIFYLLEANRLYTYEAKLNKAATSFRAVSRQDVSYFHTEFNCDSIDYLPLFIPEWKVKAPEAMGAYCLYHGNLEIEENEFAVMWLLNHVFKKLSIPFTIAGKNPSKKLAALIHKNKNCTLVANPGEKQMQDIISKAHMHVLPSFNNTGIKIKLLNALYNGRHCVVNDAMIAGTVFSSTCHVVNSAEEFKERIQLLYHQPFSKQEKKFREDILQKEFSNQANAKQIVQWIWNE